VPVDADFTKDLLYLFLRFRVLAPVVCVQDRALRRVRVREGSVDAPRTLVINDVRADLADLLRCPSKIEVVVLNLEVLPEGQKDVVRELVVVGIRLVLLLDGEAAKEQRKGNRLIERVYGRLVDNDGLIPVGCQGMVCDVEEAIVPVKVKFRQIHLIF